MNISPIVDKANPEGNLRRDEVATTPSPENPAKPFFPATILVTPVGVTLQRFKAMTSYIPKLKISLSNIRTGYLQHNVVVCVGDEYIS